MHLLEPKTKLYKGDFEKNPAGSPALICLKAGGSLLPSQHILMLRAIALSKTLNTFEQQGLRQ